MTSSPFASPPLTARFRLAAGFAVAIATLAAALAGCQNQAPSNQVCLTRQSDDLTGPKRICWIAAQTVYLTDARGKTQLLAESSPARLDRPAGPGSPGSSTSASRPDNSNRLNSQVAGVEQTLYVRLIWAINPTQSGTDPSAMNAHVGYLVRGSTTQPDRAGLYYEGMGNMYAEQPGAMGGKMKFFVRHAILRLTRSNRDRIIDPLGVVELTAEIDAGADPQAGEQIGRVVEVIDRLPPTGQFTPPPPTPEPDLPATPQPAPDSGSHHHGRRPPATP
jgi:hypothetical protein